MKLSDGEKLILWMLRDIYKHHNIEGEVDPEFVIEALMGGHLWALDWTYSGIFGAEPDSETTINEVCDVLDAWSFVESGFSNLPSTDQERVKKETGLDIVQFAGFDGNYESGHLGIARFFIDKMDRFQSFKGRELNSHHPTIDGYRRMVAAFVPKRSNLGGGNELTADDLIEILKARGGE